VGKSVRRLGDDNLAGNDGQYNSIYGDADVLKGSAVGGNDTITGGVGSEDIADTRNQLFGDALEIYSRGKGGNDVLTGGDYAENHLYGDAGAMYGTSIGGDDTLTGGSNTINFLYGDAVSLHNDARGGNDTLIGGNDSQNYMCGDAYYLLDGSVGGDDHLVGGTGNDAMYGDAAVVDPNASTGTDIFSFMQDSGTDIIYDFRQSDQDRIDVAGYGFDSIDDMTIVYGADTVIYFGPDDTAPNSVTLAAFQGTLTSDDFIFA